MSRILFVGICLIGMTVVLFAEQTNNASKKEAQKVVKTETQHVFK
ncbi:hypothetical protein [Winogradskyella sp. A3E31]